MRGLARQGPSGTIRIVVEVTFLRMSRPLPRPAAPLPEGLRLEVAQAVPVAFYRDLYDAVGADYCWWLRRILPDEDIRAVMRAPGWSLHVLYNGDSPAGFYELERRGADINLSYFGLMPSMIGRGAGRPLLEAAIESAWRQNPSALRVNTCTADHPRALPLYEAAGFRRIRQVREIWDIPDSLGLRIPASLRV
ncbi:hypothetical protein FHR90_002068 [Endobacter medicaginis]|uniref:GNAT family N-acetyltransferase n=1 Tax=Endobacter medicaginis TaxID=1181271 RepID=A0A850NTD6_9PROT|nr:GNAT family N-acetyltransferase [Endobacter medicaginis]MBB3174232.1 hypothetical protein [Endobacter medicaginis]MCX5474276.1 GNAT family N-acetyltransferase [Endobacter medicaginis]NVN30625.1 GNAT family N-acetyltransferase [Endobacter medicaginis]